MNDICVESFKLTDLEFIKIPIVVVTQNPVDYPGFVVARIFDADKPMNVHVKRKELRGIRKMIKEAYPWMISIQRGAEDEKQIVEVWM